MTKALIIDDNESIRQNIKEKIRSLDVDLYLSGEAENGSQGIKLIKKHKPEIIITDIETSKVDILGIVEYLKNNDINSQIIAMGNRKKIDKWKKKIYEDVFAFAVKPIKPEKFKKLLELANSKAESIIGTKIRLKEEEYTYKVMGVGRDKVFDNKKAGIKAFVAAIVLNKEKKLGDLKTEKMYHVMEDMRTFFSKFDSTFIVFRNSKVEDEINVICMDMEYREKVFVDLAEEIYSNTDVIMHIGIGDMVFSETDFEYSYLEAKRSLINCELVKKNRVCHIKDLKKLKEKIKIDRDLILEYVKALENANKEKLIKMSRAFFKLIEKNNKYSASSIREEMVIVLAEISRTVMMNYNRTLEGIIGYSNISSYLLEGQIIIEELREAYINALIRLVKYIKSPQEKNNAEIKMIEAYNL